MLIIEILISLFLVALSVWLINLTKTKRKIKKFEIKDNQQNSLSLPGLAIGSILFARTCAGVTSGIGSGAAIGLILHYLNNRKNKVESIKYVGSVDFPSKFYVDESEEIKVFLKGNVQSASLTKESMNAHTYEQMTLIDVNINRHLQLTEFLKVEFQGASLKINGDVYQQIDLKNDDLRFQWSVSSDKPTFHKVTLIFSKVSDSIISQLGEVKHTIKVVNLFGLTRRQVLICGILTGALALVPAILKLLEVLGYISKN